MSYVTCHRKNYKLLDPNIWEVVSDDNHKHVGYINVSTQQKSKPPRYILIADSPGNVDLPPNAVCYTREEWEREFPPELEAKDPIIIRDKQEEEVWELENKLQQFIKKYLTLKEENADLIEQNADLIKQLDAKPDVVGLSRYKLSYTWHYGTEVLWDFETKEQAEKYMQELQNFYATSLVESIKDIEYEEYIYGTVSNKS